MRLSRVMIWMVACAIPAAVVATLFTGGLMFDQRYAAFLLGTMWTFVVALGIAASCVQGLERGRAPRLMVAGVVGAVVALCLWIAIFWQIYTGPVNAPSVTRWLPGAATLFSALAVYSAAAGAMLGARLLDPAAVWLRRAILAIMAVAALHLVVAVAAFPFLEFHMMDEEEYVFRHVRWGGIYLIIIACGTLAWLGLQHVRKLIRGEEALLVRMPVTLICPRCGKAQQMQTDGDACAECGLRINVSVL